MSSAPVPSKKKRASKAVKKKAGHWVSEPEMSRLQDRLRETLETLDAIRNGEVDAVVVTGSQGSQVYSLTGAEQPYRVYVEQMEEGAVTVSSEGVILYANQRFAEMLKLPLEKVISTALPERISETVWEKIGDVISGATETVKEEDKLRRDEGEALEVSIAASRLPLEDQNVVCLVVSDLTILREQDKLRLAKEVADRANEAKDMFLAALSHELRTPLTPALMAVADLEADKSLSAETREATALIKRCIELETRLIDDLLDVTRIARGKLDMRTGPVDLHVVLRRAMEVCQTDIDAKKLRVEINLNATTCATQGDIVRLQQVFWNIIRNAVKFTAQGGTICIETSNPEDTQICVKIVDNGIGFDSLASARLFAAFEQENESVTRKFGGLGLGLAISKTVVDAHGGTLTGESKGRGKGAVFTISLPLQAVTITLQTTSTPSEQGDDLPDQDLRLLLVEDHHDTRLTMQKLLSRMGHTVTTADSGSAALHEASGQSFDLVISDIGLPDMTGIQLMRQLHEKHGLIGIAVSGFGTEEDIAESRSAGFVQHITKPLSIKDLNRALRVAFTNKG